jgi:hypothetical protein
MERTYRPVAVHGPLFIVRVLLQDPRIDDDAVVDLFSG